VVFLKRNAVNFMLIAAALLVLCVVIVKLAERFRTARPR
jgi:hypothetical protein